ncbi:MAG: hypothetical protein DMG40_03630 [Acidobacteria bacterium]|nr:MAG: hypothetical protein DMG40_03630 [Acidobacteriota bacterium]
MAAGQPPSTSSRNQRAAFDILPLVKKSKSGKGSSPLKRKGPPKTVGEYLRRVSEPARSRLNKMRAVIRSLVPRQATETISYGMPAFKHNGIMVWFAAFSDHCSLFPTASIIAKFKSQLKGFSTSKGTIHFPLDKPLPIPLIKRIVKARVTQLQKRRP